MSGQNSQPTSSKASLLKLLDGTSITLSGQSSTNDIKPYSYIDRVYSNIISLSLLSLSPIKISNNSKQPTDIGDLADRIAPSATEIKLKPFFDQSQSPSYDPLLFTRDLGRNHLPKGYYECDTPRKIFAVQGDLASLICNINTKPIRLTPYSIAFVLSVAYELITDVDTSFQQTCEWLIGIKKPLSRSGFCTLLENIGISVRAAPPKHTQSNEAETSSFKRNIFALTEEFFVDFISLTLNDYDRLCQAYSNKLRNIPLIDAQCHLLKIMKKLDSLVIRFIDENAVAQIPTLLDNLPHLSHDEITSRFKSYNLNVRFEVQTQIIVLFMELKNLLNSRSDLADIFKVAIDHSYGDRSKPVDRLKHGNVPSEFTPPPHWLTLVESLPTPDRKRLAPFAAAICELPELAELVVTHAHLFNGRTITAKRMRASNEALRNSLYALAASILPGYHDNPRFTLDFVRYGLDVSILSASTNAAVVYGYIKALLVETWNTFRVERILYANAGQDLPSLHISDGKFTLEKHDCADPSSYLIGHFTHVCYTIHSQFTVGRRMTEYANQKPHAGFYVVRKPNGRIVAASFAYLSDDKSRLVFNMWAKLPYEIEDHKLEALIEQAKTTILATTPTIQSIALGCQGNNSPPPHLFFNAKAGPLETVTAGEPTYMEKAFFDECRPPIPKEPIDSHLQVVIARR